MTEPLQPVVVVSGPAPSIASVTMINQNDPEPSSPRPQTLFEPADPSLITRDSSAKAFMRELRKVIERSDVIIQVLDARDPEGTRSRWVEEEVRKSEGQGKKLLAVMNKIGAS
jgi:nuclear GTP-binding protein